MAIMGMNLPNLPFLTAIDIFYAVPHIRTRKLISEESKMPITIQSLPLALSNDEKYVRYEKTIIPKYDYL